MGMLSSLVLCFVCFFFVLVVKLSIRSGMRELDKSPGVCAEVD